MIRLRDVVVLLVTCLGWPLAAPASNTDLALHSPAESRLLNALDLTQQGDYNGAIEDLSDLIEARPNFRLAQLVYGELMVARAGRSIDPAISDKLRDQRDSLLKEVKTRWAHHFSAQTDGKLPRSILKLAPKDDHIIVVDLTSNRLYLFANDGGVPRLVSDFYASIGQAGPGKKTEGDMRTPVGVYHITQYLDDANLPELYGVGALPINYPNAYDRAHGRTGYGIWVHGVPRATYSRTPRASEGCVAIANDDFEALRKQVQIDQTPVILTTAIDWVPRSKVAEQRRALLAAIQGWRHSWQAIDTQAYLAYYAAEFVDDTGRDKADFSAYKKRINAAKTRISVGLDQIGMFRYPGSDGMIKVTFHQDYDSSNYQAEDQKTQYWRKNDDGEWRIVLETEKD